MTDLPADEFTSLTRALERIAELEETLTICNSRVERLGAVAGKNARERDEALARLAKYEPPVDPDLVLAREIEARLHAPDYVEHVLAGIKAGREAAQVKL